MKKIQVYDPPMCCSTGVCGPDVDPKLVQFAADLKWLGEQGVPVERFNLTQTPAVFAETEVVRVALAEKGEEGLPLVVVGGKVVASGTYPTRAELGAWLGLDGAPGSLLTPAVAELVAIAAAIAANCDPCLRYHVGQAGKLGVLPGDIARAVELAANVKDAPHRNIMRLAARLTQTEPAASGCGCGDESDSGESGKGCGCS